MKAYILSGNNGEMYEDYYEWIVAVYLEKEKANKHLQLLEKIEEETYQKAINNDEYYTKCKYYIKEYEVME